MWRKSYILLNFSYARSDILVLFRAMREVTYLSYFALCLKKNSQLKQLHLKLVPKHSCAFSHNAIVKTLVLQQLKHLFSSFSLYAKLHSCVDLRPGIYAMRKITYLCLFAPCSTRHNCVILFTYFVYFRNAQSYIFVLFRAMREMTIF